MALKIFCSIDLASIEQRGDRRKDEKNTSLFIIWVVAMYWRHMGVTDRIREKNESNTKNTQKGQC